VPGHSHHGGKLERLRNGVHVSATIASVHRRQHNDKAGAARKLWRFDLSRTCTSILPARSCCSDWGNGRGHDGNQTGS